MSPTQPMEALSLANEYRFAVARKRKELAGMSRAEAHAALADLVERSEDRFLLSGRVRHYLVALPRRGDQYAERVMRGLGVSSADRRLRDLTPRQRRELGRILRMGERGR